MICPFPLSNISWGIQYSVNWPLLSTLASSTTFSYLCSSLMIMQHLSKPAAVVLTPIWTPTACWFWSKHQYEILWLSSSVRKDFSHLESFATSSPVVELASLAFRWIEFCKVQVCRMGIYSCGKKPSIYHIIECMSQVRTIVRYQCMVWPMVGMLITCLKGFTFFSAHLPPPITLLLNEGSKKN